MSQRVCSLTHRFGFGSSEMCTLFFLPLLPVFLQIICVQLRPDYCNNSYSHWQHQCYDTMAFVVAFWATENVHYDWNSAMKPCVRRQRTIPIDIISLFYIISRRLFRFVIPNVGRPSVRESSSSSRIFFLLSRKYSSRTTNRRNRV